MTCLDVKDQDLPIGNIAVASVNSVVRILTQAIHILLMKAIVSQWSSPYGTLDLDPMRIGDPDPETALRPHSLDTDPRCALCCATGLRDSA